MSMLVPDSSSTRSVAIIGAGGFIGRALLRRLNNRAFDLRCYGRAKVIPDLPDGIDWFSGDLTESSDATLADAVRGCETVIHLASTSTPANADRNILVDAQENVLGSLRLFDTCVSAGVRRLIFLSSGGTVYGVAPATPTPEFAPTQPINAYGAAKLAIEKYLEVYRLQRGLDYTVLRVANAFGPYQTAAKGQGVVAAFLSKALKGVPIEIWGDGSVVRDYIYIEDVADAIWASLAYSGSQRVFNIGSGFGRNLNQIISDIEQTLDVTVIKQFLAGRPADVPVSVLDCQLAKQELGWQSQMEFSAGLCATAEWLRQHNG